MSGYSFKLLCEHYKKVKYYPDTEYRLQNPFSTVKFVPSSEEEFRERLFEFKPLFIMNKLPDCVYIDFDFKLRVFTESVFKKALFIVENTIERVRRMIDVDRVEVVFSGRGFHAYVYTPVIERTKELYEEIGFGFSNDYSATLNKVIVKRLVDDRVPGWKFLDPSSGAGYKMDRTLYSINDKSFLPVVPVEDFDNFNIDAILNSVFEPRKFYVVLRRKLPVRVYDKVIVCDKCDIDEYELARLLVKNNLLIKRWEQL